MSLVQWSALVGALLPTVVALVNQPRWPAWARAAAAGAVCLLAGLITAAAAGELSGKTWLESAGVVFGAAMLTYHTWWKPSGVTSAIERATALPQVPLG